jgi:hypothetical protein
MFACRNNRRQAVPVAAMTPEQMYQELKDLADKLQVTVSEKSFRNIGIAVSSGFCIVKNENRCILDKRLKLPRKVEVLAECLAGMSHEDVFVVPAVRELLSRFGPPADSDKEKQGAQSTPEHQESSASAKKFT